MYFKDGQGIDIEVLIENQITSFPDALCCTYEDW
jgi:hypothetical protein